MYRTAECLKETFQRTEGHLVQVEVKGLMGDVVYEFRVACRNAKGRGEFGPQSVR